MAISNWFNKGKNALFRSNSSVTSKLIGPIRDTDTFICSYPKSGNTWLRFIIANGISNEEISLISVNKHVPDIYNFSTEIKDIEGPRFIKTHHPDFNDFPSCIYIVRDYRDVLVSYYHYMLGHGHSYSWDEFINQSDLLNKPFGSWEKHVNLAQQRKSESPNSILIIRYEDLLEKSLDMIESIFSYLNITPVKSIEQIDKLCGFEAMAANERKYGKLAKNPNFTFFRQGKERQWEEYMSNAAWGLYLSHDQKRTMKNLGYTL